MFRSSISQKKLIQSLVFFKFYGACRKCHTICHFEWKLSENIAQSTSLIFMYRATERKSISFSKGNSSGKTSNFHPEHSAVVTNAKQPNNKLLPTNNFRTCRRRSSNSEWVELSEDRKTFPSCVYIRWVSFDSPSLNSQCTT